MAKSGRPVISTYQHALRIWLEEHVHPPWRRALQPEAFAALVQQAERAGFRFTSRYRLEQALRAVLAEGD
jgi:hypothetical protein